MNLNMNVFLVMFIIDLNILLLVIYVIKYWFKIYKLNLMCLVIIMFNKMEIYVKFFLNVIIWSLI